MKIDFADIRLSYETSNFHKQAMKEGTEMRLQLDDQTIRARVISVENLGDKTVVILHSVAR